MYVPNLNFKTCHSHIEEEAMSPLVFYYRILLFSLLLSQLVSGYLSF